MALMRCRSLRPLGSALLAVVAVALVGCGSSDPAPSAATSAEQAPSTLEGARPSAGCEATATTSAPDAAAAEPRSVVVDGAERTYLLSTGGTQPGVPAPVVVLLHGMGSSAADINRVTGLPEAAAEAGMIVVTPQAVGSPTIWRPAAQGPDAAFLDQVLDDVGRTQCIDTARIQVTGFSVGAALATAYSCARPDEVASIVTVTVEFPGGCTRPMPILSFHGTADPVVAYGNSDPNAPGGITGTEANMATWAATGGCGPTPAVTEVGSEVTRLEWPDCADGAEVVLYRIVGGGHAWPGQDPATAVAAGTQQISATDQAIDFSRRHAL